MKVKVKRKYVATTPRIDEMVAELQEEKGFKSFNEVVQWAIMEAHSKTFKDYVMVRKLQAGKTPEEKAETLIRVQEIKKQKEEDALMAIAMELNGIVSGPSGDKRVKYFTYDKSNRYEQEVPLEMMSPELVQAQYFPDKETILQRQKEGKVNYSE